MSYIPFRLTVKHSQVINISWRDFFYTLNNCSNFGSLFWVKKEIIQIVNSSQFDNKAGGQIILLNAGNL